MSVAGCRLEIVVNPAQTSALRKAALGLATLLVLLECGWGITGAALGLASAESPVFPSFLGVPENVVFGFILIGVFVACCQTLAVWCQSVVLSLLVGIAFVFPGVLVLGFGAIALALISAGLGGFHHDELDWFYNGVIPCAIGGTWLFIGVVMILHAVGLSEHGDSLESPPG